MADAAEQHFTQAGESPRADDDEGADHFLGGVGKIRGRENVF